VLGGQPNRAGLLLRSNPDSPGSADEGKQIVADQNPRALHCTDHGIVRIGAHGIEFVCNTQDHASGVGAVRLQGKVVWGQEQTYDRLRGLTTILK
jgi:hypothetical protein